MEKITEASQINTFTIDRSSAEYCSLPSLLPLLTLSPHSYPSSLSPLTPTPPHSLPSLLSLLTLSLHSYLSSLSPLTPTPPHSLPSTPTPPHSLPSLLPLLTLPSLPSLLPLLTLSPQLLPLLTLSPHSYPSSLSPHSPHSYPSLLSPLLILTIAEKTSAGMFRRMHSPEKKKRQMTVIRTEKSM